MNNNHVACIPNNKNYSNIKQKWNAVSKRRKERAKQEYTQLDDFITKEYKADPQAYLVGFFERKSKVECSYTVYSIIAALAINLTWQFISNFLFSTSMSFGVPSDLAFVLKVFALAMDFLFLAFSLAIVYVFCYFNKKEKKRLFLEEFILRKHDYLS